MRSSTTIPLLLLALACGPVVDDVDAATSEESTSSAWSPTPYRCFTGRYPYSSSATRIVAVCGVDGDGAWCESSRGHAIDEGMVDVTSCIETRDLWCVGPGVRNCSPDPGMCAAGGETCTYYDLRG